MGDDSKKYMNARVYEKIVVPYDGLAKTTGSVRWASRVAQSLGAHLFVVHIVSNKTVQTVMEERDVGSLEEAHEYCRKHYSRSFANLESISRPDVKCTMEVAFGASSAEGIVDFCHSNTVDLVVTRCPTNISSLKTTLPQHVISNSDIDCLMYKHGANSSRSGMLVLIPVDNRKGTMPCVCRGISIARGFSGKVLFYYSVEHELPFTRHQCPDEVRQNLDYAEKLAADAGVDYEILLESKPFVEGIVETAVGMDVDLIVMKDFSKEYLMGSVGSVLKSDTGGISREDLYFGSAAILVDERCAHNFLYTKERRKESVCSGCQACNR